MNENEIRELLPDYVGGLLDAETTAQIDKHIQNSESLKKECDELRAYFNSIRTLEPVKAPNNFLHNVQNRITAISPLKKITRKLFHPLQVKIPLELAGLAATVVIVVFLFHPFDLDNIPPIEFDDVSEREKEEKKNAKPAAEQESGQPTEETSAMNEALVDIDKKEEPKAKIQPKAPKRKAKAIPTSKIATSVSSNAKRSNASIRDEPPAAPPSSGPKKGAGKSIGLFKAQEDLAGGASAQPIMESEETLSDDELFARAVIERSDSIVKRRMYPEPEAVDVGLLALSIQKKNVLPLKVSTPESAARDSEYDQKKKTKTLKFSLREGRQASKRKKSKEEPPKGAPEAKDVVQPVSAHELIFAQIESKIKLKKGKVTLLKDKTQTAQKKHYMVEILPSLFPALRQELEAEGILIDNNFHFDSLQVNLIQFNLIVDIK